MNTRWWEIDIHGCYSLVKITFAPICVCKDNRWIWHHNASTSLSHVVTDRLWRGHNVMLEKTVFSDNGEMSNQWLFFSEMGCSGHEIACKKWHNILLSWKTIFGHSWCFHSWFRHSWKSWQITSLVTKNFLFTVTHALFYISSKSFRVPWNQWSANAVHISWDVLSIILTVKSLI